MKYVISLLLLTVFCWQPVVAQSDIELTDSTSTDWGDNIGGGFLPVLPTDPVTSLTLSMTDITLDGGDRFRLTAQTNSTAANKAVTWSVADKKIAIVSGNGTVTGLKTGSTIVTATSVSNPEISASCKVTVISDYVAPSSGWILPWGKEEAWTMKYKYFEQANYVEPSNDIFGRSWKELNYDDTSWETLTGPMGSEGIWYAPFNYVWYGEYNCFCLRRTFDLPVVGTGIYSFRMQHDDDIKVYLNGKLVIDEPDYTDERISTYEIPNDAFVAGENMLAIYIQQNWGGAYLDYGLYYDEEGDGEKDLAEIIVHAENGGIVDGAGIYQKGTEVTLTAIPNDGYRFVQWSDGSIANPYTFILYEPTELTAFFEPIEGSGDLEDRKIVAIPAGKYNVFYTDNNGKRWYLHAADYNNWAVSETPQTIKFTNGNVTDGQAFANAASFMESNGYYMSNVANGDGTGPINTEPVNEGFGLEKRTWESQVFYKNDEGKHAIRLTNTVGTDWGCHLFVNINPATLEVSAGHPSLGDALYLWEIEKSEIVYKVYYYIGEELVHTVEVVSGEKIPEYIYTQMKEGHTFNGWTGLPDTMPAKDVTVTGSYTANTYKVTYMLDGELFKTEQVVYGTAIPTPEVPAKEGYNFSGWGEMPATMPAKDLTITGSYTINKDLEYNLIYMVDGVEYKRVTLSFMDEITLEAEPAKEGHTFSGWSEVPETMPLHDVTVTGSFTANSYTLTYVLDGTTFKTETVVFGTAVTTPEVPTKEGHTFAGWTNVPATMPAEDVTVTGGYTINHYTLIYMVGGIEYKKIELEYGASITVEAVPTKEGHTFSGWSEIPATMPAKDVTVTGSFTANSYKVTYILDGETFKTETVTYGTAIPTPEVPAKPGYNFSGWGEIPATMPAKDLTFTGSYTINKDNKFNVIYMVDGTEYKRVVVSFGDPIEVLATPTKEGHTFSGWSEVPETMPLHDVTVTGTFTANSYTLTYVLDGETFKTESVVFGTVITTPEAPAIEGYTFAGWTNVPATMPAKDVTVTGTYTINKYTLTYMVDGTVYKTSELEYGATITAEAAPIKEGYLFSGWSEIPETMPAKDIEVTGHFEVDGIDAVLTDQLVDVYTLQGVMLRRQISVDELKHELSRGIYIINGKKVMVR